MSRHDDGKGKRIDKCSGGSLFSLNPHASTCRHLSMLFAFLCPGVINYKPHRNGEDVEEDARDETLEGCGPDSED